MKKLVFIMVFLISCFGYSQKHMVDVVKYKNVTTTVRDSYVVPSGETWLIWNSTTTQWEFNISGAGWNALTVDTDDQVASEVPVTATGFNGNLTTGDTNLQLVAQKLDDLNINLGGGIVASGTFTTSTAVSQVVTHSLGYAPAISRIFLVGYNDLSAVTPQIFVEDITSTQMTIRVSSMTGDVTIGWAIFGTDSETPLDFGEVASGLDTELGSSDWRTGVSTASEVSLVDANGNTTETNVEGAIDELYGAVSNTAVGETVLSASRAGVATDSNGIITNSTASNYTYTINTGIFEVGEMLLFENFSTGDIIIAYGAGVTGDDAQTININGNLTLWQRTLDDWTILDGEAVLTQAEYTALSAGLKANGRFEFLFTD